MDQHIDQVWAAFETNLKSVSSVADVTALQVHFLGKKGALQQLMKELRDVPNETRPQVGKQINDLKNAITQACEERLGAFMQVEQEKRLVQEKVDVTLPGRGRFGGSSHLVHQMLHQIIEIFVEMGFSVQDGPEIETEYYNFEALHFPKDHPARDMQDTFYIDDTVLLRTQTSNIQARVMEATPPPIRIICPGRVYRNETVTARSHVFFHQVDGLYIERGVAFTHLLGTLQAFIHKLLGTNTKIRYRPSYFPFVEPGLEVDVSCALCLGKGCSMCKGSGWVEILGAGMVHPEVLKNGGIDPEVYSGYAWGMGVERLVSMRYGIRDIRLHTQNDLRYLSQFPALT